MFGFRKFEFTIAKRYQKNKGEGGSNAVTRLSLLGITLAVFALVATLSVRAGYKDDFLNTILGSNPHIVVTDPSSNYVSDFGAIAQITREIPNVENAYPVTADRVIVSYAGVEGGAEVLGIIQSDLESIPLIASPKRSKGVLDLTRGQIAIGSGIADNLGIQIGDKIRIFTTGAVAKGDIGNINTGEFTYKPRLTASDVEEATPKADGVETFRVSYIFEVGREEVDNARIYMDLGESRRFFEKSSGVDAIHVLLRNPNETLSSKTDIVNSVFQGLGQGVQAQTWKEASATLLSAMALEDKAMFIILTILILIASLNIVSGLVMLVKTKTSDIGILRTMGFKRGAILRIFFIAGAYIGVVGTLAGLVLGILFALNIHHVMDALSLILEQDPEMVGVEAIRLTAKIQIFDILVTIFGSLFICFAITLFPAMSASRLDPIKALKND